MVSLKRRLLEKEFGDHAAAIEANTVYCPSGCGEDIEVNPDIDRVYLNLLKAFLERKFLFNGKSRAYTRNQLAEKLVELDVASDVREANGFVSELLQIRRAKGSHGYCFKMESRGKQDPVYFAVKEGAGD